MEQSLRVIAYELLRDAILEIRMYAASTEQNPAAITGLANLIHNWPRQLERAATESDFAELLHEAWDRADAGGRAWLRFRLMERGVDPGQFPPTEFRE